MEQRAIVYKGKAAMFVVPISRTTDGFWTGDGTFRELPVSSPASAVGDALLEALGQSKVDVETPPRSAFAERLRPLVTAARVANWASFARTAKNVDACLRGGVLTLTPGSYLGRGAFEPVPERTVNIAPWDATEVGLTLLKVLDSS